MKDRFKVAAGGWGGGAWPFDIYRRSWGCLGDILGQNYKSKTTNSCWWIVKPAPDREKGRAIRSSGQQTSRGLLSKTIQDPVKVMFRYSRTNCNSWTTQEVGCRLVVFFGGGGIRSVGHQKTIRKIFNLSGYYKHIQALRHYRANFKIVRLVF